MLREGLSCLPPRRHALRLCGSGEDEFRFRLRVSSFGFMGSVVSVGFQGLGMRACRVWGLGLRDEGVEEQGSFCTPSAQSR